MIMDTDKHPDGTETQAGYMGRGKSFRALSKHITLSAAQKLPEPHTFLDFYGGFITYT